MSDFNTENQAFKEALKQWYATGDESYHAASVDAISRLLRTARNILKDVVGHGSRLMQLLEDDPKAATHIAKAAVSALLLVQDSGGTPTRMITDTDDYLAGSEFIDIVSAAISETSLRPHIDTMQAESEEFMAAFEDLGLEL